MVFSKMIPDNPATDPPALLLLPYPVTDAMGTTGLLAPVLLLQMLDTRLIGREKTG